jgi:predicted N-acetyltransferase YhbS
MRGAFSDNPGLIHRLMDLLDVVFPGIRRGAVEAARMGASWESASTPFGAVEGDRIVSHVGVIELPLVVRGQAVAVGSIHGVATDPDSRRRGHYRRVMDEVLAYCDERYETQILTTKHPEYFAPFGFRAVTEHLVRAPGRAGSGSDGVRLLDTDDAADIELLHRLLSTGEPVSRTLGVVRERGVFCFNEGRRPLRCAPDLDVLLCLERDGGSLMLFDVAGPRLPPLADVLARGIGDPTVHVEVSAFVRAAARFRDWVESLSERRSVC